MFGSIKSNHSVLVAGLVIMSISVVLSLLAIFRLDESITQRRNAFVVVDKTGELDNKIADWFEAISNVSSVVETPEQVKIMEKRIDENFEALRVLVSDNPDETALLNISQKAWEREKKNYYLGRRIGKEDFAGVLAELDRKEIKSINRKKIIRHDPIIFENTRKLIIYIVFSIFIGLFLFLFSIFSKIKQDKKWHQIIEELGKTREEAISASNLKSKFLSTVSHEIRTPLNGIIGLSDVLVNSDHPDENKKLAKTILQSGKSLLRIINDILDFSKIESGKLDLESSEFSIVEIVEQVLLILRPKATKKGIWLKTEIAPDVPEKVWGDSGRITQILFNLAGNAVKFTSVGGVILRVQTVGSENGKILVRFSVDDTGHGISPEEEKNLFLPFAQGKSGTATGEAGSGLGLSISRQIVAAMGGNIQFTSEVGRGTRFWFDIPFAMFSEEKVGILTTVESHSDPEDEEKINVVRGWTPRVLVVEDNPANQIVAQTMLSQFGAESTLAANGLEAVEIAKESRLDLIFMDCEMPVMDGFEATKVLRREQIYIPIIALTANVSKEHEAKCLEAGMDGFLPKPFLLGDIDRVFNRFLPGPIEVSKENLKNMESQIGRESTLKVVLTYLSTISEFQNQLDTFLKRADHVGAQRLGHKFRSSSLAVGVIGFSKLCKELEESETLEKAMAVGEHLKCMVPQVERWLNTFVHFHQKDPKTSMSMVPGIKVSNN